MNPKVSVIVPVYNVEKYIHNTMKSICEQTYRQIEVIMVDDGSQDNSISIALELLQLVPDISYSVIRQENSGQGTARNVGVENATGEWILFMDSDDVLQRTAIQRLINVAIQDSCDFVFLDFQKVSIGDEFLPGAYDNDKELLTGQELQFEFLVRSKPVIVPGTLYNKKWYKDNQLSFEKNRFSEDQHFLWRAIVAAKRVGHVRAVLYNYLTHPNSIMTGSKVEQFKIAYKIFCELQKILEENPETIPEVKKWMLDRWTLGMLRTGAAILNWDEFKDLMLEVDGVNHSENMCDFPDGKVQISSKILRVSPKLYYRLFHRVGIR